SATLPVDFRFGKLCPVRLIAVLRACRRHQESDMRRHVPGPVLRAALLAALSAGARTSAGDDQAARAFLDRYAKGSAPLVSAYQKMQLRANWTQTIHESKQRRAGQKT